MSEQPKPKHPGGRPPKFKTVEELQAKINEYFEKGVKTKKISSGGKIVEIPVPTITGLVLYLGFCDRRSFYDMEKLEKFTHAIKRARTFIEKNYEELIQSNNPGGAIFALKNFGWTDKREHEHSGAIQHQFLNSAIQKANNVPDNDERE